MHACTRARVHACSTSLGLSVWYYVPHTYVSHISSAPKIRICRYVCTRATSPPPKKEQKAQHRLRERHTHNATLHSKVRVTTTVSVTEGVPAVSWIQSLMIRRPFGSIDPNSIRETELHTESRRRHSRGERESLHSPQPVSYTHLTLPTICSV